MAWNEPGKGGNPWNSGGGKQGPPDLDKVARDLQRKLSGVFGGKGRGTGSGGGGGRAAGAGLGLVAAAGVVLWLLSGFYQVDEAERGVVLQFGAYHKTTLPGLHWHIPYPIQRVETVNVAQVDSFTHSTRMLTADENIVSVDLRVQFRRTDAQAFLFNVRDPEQTLGEVTETAIREVVGKSLLDFVLTEGRAEVAVQAREIIQSTLDSYGTGIEVTSVNLEDANFPSQVEAAVQDAIKAREDRDRLALEAEAYANDVVPRARGGAARLMESAEAYRAQVIAEAEGETDRFLALLAEYTRAPQVTRQRLYFETMEQVLGNASKILVDAPGSGTLMYLPIEELLKRSGGASTRLADPADQGQASQPRQTERAAPPTTDLRSRGTR
ncbi:FtsH protease activity modulator HflK [Thioalkalivibrio sp. XN8]|uniref:FtsH protease activity modulator HflK n=1 Tax=Thioalkalivibrio sp. XN8 TaxID=2712863 RepID=UPI0013E9B3AC|nr:FtsH protease activity modulator HflK [Thioalkalivibrio sp. XN8]NGP54278.1 FtsH protease activity modulator HflK [Thioalkalivibrio sp. XN8]